MHLHFKYLHEDWKVRLRLVQIPGRNLEIHLEDKENDTWAEFAQITMEAPKCLPQNQAYLDTLYLPGVEHFIQSNRLGYPTGKYMEKGLGTYPLYEFNLTRCANFV